MDFLFQALHSAYADTWEEIIAGAIVIDLMYFAAGVTFYFLLYQRRASGLSLKQLPRYIVDPRLVRNDGSAEDELQSAKIDRRSWLLRFLWLPPLTAIMLTLALALGALLGTKFNQWFGTMPPVEWPSWTILICQTSVIFLIGDFGNYWNHRWMHRIPLYWSFHRVHHSAETLNYFTGDREHPLEVLPSYIIQAFWNGLGTAIVVWATGTALLSDSLFVLIALGVVWNLRNILFHSHIPLSFGRLDYLIGGPIMHQLHHSAEAEHFSRNFGVQLFCWDWLFGTIYVPAKGEKFRLGLAEEELGHNNPHRTLTGYYLEPLRHAWQTFSSVKIPQGDTSERERNNRISDRTT